MTRMLRYLIVGLLMAGLLTAMSWADVVGWSSATYIEAGESFSLPLTLNATDGEELAGINGELVYDSTLFTVTSVTAGEGASGATVLSYEATAGTLRFLVFMDPATSAFDLSQPIVYFNITASDSLPTEDQEFSFVDSADDPDATTGVSAVSTTAGTSVANVTFSDVRIALELTAAGDWMLYK